jgi:hypothetical protein
MEPNKSRLRDKLINFRVTQSEADRIDKNIKLSGLGKERYLRAMAIEGKIFKQDLESVRLLAAEIKKIGVNINQIAKVANETGSVESDSTDVLNRHMEEIWQLVKSTLLKRP